MDFWTRILCASFFFCFGCLEDAEETEGMRRVPSFVGRTKSEPVGRVGAEISSNDVVRGIAINGMYFFNH